MSSSQSWRNVKGVLVQALDVASDQREAFLDDVCGDDDTLRAEVVSLLKIHDEQGELPDVSDLIKVGHAMNELLRMSGQRKHVGPYKLIEEIGKGGMGIVYLAERADGEFKRQVAIKLLKFGVETDDLVDRFRIERQVLARLEHPNIARLIDGGVTEEGLPWFAMEYANGVPITRFCHENRLSVDQRLGLFLKVCRAVQHAHNQLIIHRDLKPPNILVTSDGEPRVLDFGLAKVLEGQGESFSETVPDRRWLTLEYASPEQVRGESVGTPSDTYQLGMVLYEILTGRRPYSIKGLSRSEAERVICEVKPIKPSTAVVVDDGWNNRSAETSIELQRLSKRLKGDLDAILLKVLHKDAERGYSTAGALAVDIERHLQSLPVDARPDTVGYRTRAFVRRHRLAVAGAGMSVFLLAASSVILALQQAETVRQRDEAQIERDKAKEVTEFLTGLFQSADPFNRHLGQMTVQDALDFGVERMESELRDRPAIRAELLGAMAQIYVQHYDAERAIPLIEEELAILRNMHADGSPDLAAALLKYGRALSQLGDKDGALRSMHQSLAMHIQFLGDDHPVVAQVFRDIGVTLSQSGRRLESEPYFREAVAIHERTGRTIDYTRTLDALGEALLGQGRYNEAEIVLRQAAVEREHFLLPHQPGIATVRHALGVVLTYQGRFAEAEPLLREALEINRTAFGEGHYRVPRVMEDLARLLRWTSREDEATTLLLNALALQQRHGHSPSRSLLELGLLAHAFGKRQEADGRYRDSLEASEGRLQATHPDVIGAKLGLGRILFERGYFDEAEPLLEEVLSLSLVGTGEQSDDTARARIALGLLFAAQGRSDEATELLKRGLQRLRNFPLAEPALLADADRTLLAFELEVKSVSE